MTYRHAFRVRASLSEVACFHSAPSSMAVITPPPVVVRFQQAPAQMSEGEEIRFTLWMGPLPVRWTARIEALSPTGFTDRQVRGPFRTWVHRHTFLPLDENVTEVRDEVTVALRRHLLWGPVGLLMQLSLPLLFAYRGWKTRRTLEAG
jgi:ligand-binding SRPBCC domain-containing protein